MAARIIRIPELSKDAPSYDVLVAPVSRAWGDWAVERGVEQEVEKQLFQCGGVAVELYRLCAEEHDLRT